MMLTDKRFQILLFAVSGFILAVWGFLAIMDIPLQKRGRYYSIEFDRVTGLTESDPVTVKGIKVGSVRDMNFTAQGVAVNIWLSDDIHLKADSKAAIKALGMIGEKYIDLIPGRQGERLAENAAIQGRYISDLSDSSEDLEIIMANARLLTAKLEAAIQPAEFSAMTQNAAASARSLNRLLSRLERAAGRWESDIDTMLTTGSRLAVRHESTVDATLSDLAAGADRLPIITARLDSILTHLQTVSRGLAQGRGTAGALLTRDSLYVSVTQTVSSLDSLIADVRKHPGKYVRASLIGF